MKISVTFSGETLHEIKNQAAAFLSGVEGAAEVTPEVVADKPKRGRKPKAAAEEEVFNLDDDGNQVEEAEELEEMEEVEEAPTTAEVLKAIKAFAAKSEKHKAKAKKLLADQGVKSVAQLDDDGLRAVMAAIS